MPQPIDSIVHRFESFLIRWVVLNILLLLAGNLGARDIPYWNTTEQAVGIIDLICIAILGLTMAIVFVLVAAVVVLLLCVQLLRVLGLLRDEWQRLR